MKLIKKSVHFQTNLGSSQIDPQKTNTFSILKFYQSNKIRASKNFWSMFLCETTSQDVLDGNIKSLCQEHFMI